LLAKNIKCLRLLLPCPVATATTIMARSTTQATTATGGVVHRTIVATPTTAT